jgi:hypothetical protein
MKHRTRCIALLAATAVHATVALAAPGYAKVERDRDATQVAKAWFTSLIQGETAVTTSLSVTPFLFDNKQEVKTLTNLKRLYDQIVKDKGKRNVKPTSVKIQSSSDKKVEIVLMIEDEGIVVIVKPGEAYRVVGFRD